METQATYPRRAKLLFQVTNMPILDADPKDLALVNNKLTRVEDLRVIEGAYIKRVVPTIVSLKKPMVGDKVYYNGKRYILLELYSYQIENRVVVSGTPKYKTFNMAKLATIDCPDYKGSSIKVLAHKIYLKTIVPLDRMNDRFIAAIVHGKIREGFILNVKFNKGIGAKDSIFLVNDKAVITPIRGSKDDKPKIKKEVAMHSKYV